jgi:hypothetical protein
LSLLQIALTLLGFAFSQHESEEFSKFYDFFALEGHVAPCFVITLQNSPSLVGPHIFLSIVMSNIVRNLFFLWPLFKFVTCGLVWVILELYITLI